MDWKQRYQSLGVSNEDIPRLEAFVALVLRNSNAAAISTESL